MFTPFLRPVVFNRLAKRMKHASTEGGLFDGLGTEAVKAVCTTGGRATASLAAVALASLGGVTCMGGRRGSPPPEDRASPVVVDNQFDPADVVSDLVLSSKHLTLVDFYQKTTAGTTNLTVEATVARAPMPRSLVDTAVEANGVLSVKVENRGEQTLHLMVLSEVDFDSPDTRDYFRVLVPNTSSNGEGVALRGSGTLLLPDPAEEMQWTLDRRPAKGTNTIRVVAFDFPFRLVPESDRDLVTVGPLSSKLDRVSGARIQIQPTAGRTVRLGDAEMVVNTLGQDWEIGSTYLSMPYLFK